MVAAFGLVEGTALRAVIAIADVANDFLGLGEVSSLGKPRGDDILKASHRLGIVRERSLWLAPGRIPRHHERTLSSKREVAHVVEKRRVRLAAVALQNRLRRLAGMGEIGHGIKPDRARGVRATCMDDADSLAKGTAAGKNHYAEAIVLATKVQHAPGIVAEICVSDDPDYVTGYVATRGIGYQRITVVKEKGDPSGGRIFLYRGPREQVPETIRFLEQQAVIVENVPSNRMLRLLHGLGSMALGFLYSCRKFFYERRYVRRWAGENIKLVGVFRLKLAIGFFMAFASLDFWTRLWDRWNRLYRDCKSEYVTISVGRRHYFGELARRADLCETYEMEWEGATRKVPRDIDGYMCRLYGPDFMTPPPPEHREKHVLFEPFILPSSSFSEGK